jgi:hypothetical protein
MGLTEGQVRFFDTFGFLVLPQLVADEIGEITAEFEAVFQDRGAVHDGTQRTTVVPFIDQRARLCALLDHPEVEGAVASLLGDDFNYVAGDGNYYSGDTGWHSDGFHTVGEFVKVALYLDPVGRDSGALRVIPGSHRVGNDWAATRAARSQELWGVGGRDVPAVSLDSRPGDVVVFNHNLMHAAFGGGHRRRMFTMNCCRRCRTPEEIADLKDFIATAARFWIPSLYTETMLSTASPARMRHLEQVLASEGHLPALAAAAQARMAEPARG